MEKIKKLWKASGKFDDQQQYKAIIKAEIISTPKKFIDNSKISPIQSVIVKNPRARKSLHQFLEALDVKPKTDVHRFVPLNKSERQSKLVVCCGIIY